MKRSSDYSYVIVQQALSVMLLVPLFVASIFEGSTRARKDGETEDDCTLPDNQWHRDFDRISHPLCLQVQLSRVTVIKPQSTEHPKVAIRYHASVSRPVVWLHRFQNLRHCLSIT